MKCEIIKILKDHDLSCHTVIQFKEGEFKDKFSCVRLVKKRGEGVKPIKIELGQQTFITLPKEGFYFREVENPDSQIPPFSGFIYDWSPIPKS